MGVFRVWGDTWGDVWCDMEKRNVQLGVTFGVTLLVDEKSTRKFGGETA